MATRRFSRARAPQRRKLVWARQFIFAPLTLSAGAVTIFNLMNDFTVAMGAEPLGTTVMRVRGHLQLRGGTAGNGIRAAAGLTVAPQTITSSLLDPAANASVHADWMYWEAFHLEPVVATEFATLNMHTIDVKSRRKVEELGETLFLALKNTHPSDGLSFTYSMSVLLALP